MLRINVPLDQEEGQALLNLALKEKRHPRLQAAFIIRRWLEQENLLPATQPLSNPQEIPHEKQN